MKFRIEDLDVYFPYEYIYPEQYEYMVELKRTLDAKGHCVLEMPTGTGKTITLLSLITSYQMARKGTGKLVYCTRTVHEMEKALAELRLLHAYQQTALAGEAAAGAGAGGNGAGGKGASGVPRILALGLSSRKNLCIHPVVAGEGSRESVDAGCRKRTASWVRAAALENPDIEVCTYFDQFDRKGQEAALPPGVYTLQDLRAFGREKGWCPYFLARHMINFANVVVYNYQYLLDPKVSGIISRELERESIVVFDKTHNIDNVCIEALSVNVRQQTIDGAHRNLARLNTTIERFKATGAERLKEEYRRLVDGLAQRGNLPDTWLDNPVLPATILQEAVPCGALPGLLAQLPHLPAPTPSHLPAPTPSHLPAPTPSHLPAPTPSHLPIYRTVHLTSSSLTLPTSCQPSPSPFLSSTPSPPFPSPYYTWANESTSDMWLANPLLPADILQEAVPGNIRRAEHFLAFLRRFLSYLQARLNTTRVESEGPLAFLHALQATTGIESKSLQLCYDRLQSLLLTLQVAEVDEMGHVQCVCDLATLVGTYTRGFAIIIEPFDERQPQLADPVLQVGAAGGCCRWVLHVGAAADGAVPLSFLPFPSLTLSTTLRPHPSPPPPLSAPTPLRAHPSPRPPLSVPTPLRAHPSPPPPHSSPCPAAELSGRLIGHPAHL
ncbi:unnamed protein product [Closterium sp. Naga37s-1]|nr:unnamed protein product [Closterium sp. Naga37s-1]CAI5536100.1 unnamed protein product [Closterium sp. Naga37s-1]